MAESTIPEFNSHEMKCAMCGQAMFYSQENLVHVCLDESHGILCYFEPDSCWFAASEKTALELGNRGLKFHYIPKSVFENGGIGEAFKCDYSEDKKSK
ncbi:MAG: hypothetical protein JRN52_05230 [Nitrososphaerota archaeon]|nr:hypothetical protein [Nitrososphaerota archaeon]